MSDGIAAEIAAAMRWARERAGASPEQFARELNRLVLSAATASAMMLSGDLVEMMEAGEIGVHAEHLVAAARIAEQPVSVILGEMPSFTVTIPDLERRVAALEAADDRRVR